MPATRVIARGVLGLFALGCGPTVEPTPSDAPPVGSAAKPEATPKTPEPEPAPAPEPEPPKKPEPEPEPEPEPAPHDAAEEADADEGDTSAMGDGEHVGDLHLGMPAADVVAKLGAPARKGKKAEEEATGDVVQTWSYPKAGISIDMFDVDAGQQIGRFTVEPPCTLATPRGIKIGSTLAEVEKAYGAERDAEMSDEQVFIAGSVYGGIFFRIEDGKVASIFVGAGAE